MSETIGPNVRRLIAERMAVQMIPPGSGKDAVAVGAQAILAPGSLQRHAREASEWVKAAIGAVKAAPDNPYGDDDEVIAGELLRQIRERRGKNDLRH